MPLKQATAYLGLGGNLGDAHETLLQAMQELALSEQVISYELSPFYCSAPIDSNGPDYTNACAKVITTFNPLELLHTLQALELKYGRTRPYKNAPRTIDLDILLFDDEQWDSAELIIPHPRMHERAFVLKPLQDLGLNQLKQGDVAQLLIACNDQAIKAFKK